ncbi:MAG: tetratricopeptide repeat protein, partial [Bacteroidales bacterium]
MKRILLISSFITIFIAGFALNADSLYLQKDYIGAMKGYEAQLKETPSARLFYNLGNCHYRLNNYPKAVLNYERCLKLDPSCKDAQFNLDLIRTKLPDRFAEKSEMFFVRWYQQTLQAHSADEWGLLALPAWALTLVLFALYLLLRSPWQRRLSFALFILSLLFTLTLHVFAAVRNHQTKTEVRAVLMQATDTFTQPALTSKKDRALHEGTAFTVTDTYGKDW